MATKKLKEWFDGELAGMLSKKIRKIDPDFNTRKFKSKIVKGTPPLELKDRIALFSEGLMEQYDHKYPKALKTLVKILGPENEEETGMFTNFYWVMPIAFMVEKYGHDHYDKSMNAIKEITKRNTSEYAIRPYLELFPKECLTQMKAWSKDENFHVRRLSCEGVRPRLPWAKKLDRFIQNPKPIVPILNQLKDDKSKYVQKSVANCLNDILKDNLEIGKTIIEKWNTKSASIERKWIIKHALRNLKKAKDPWALSILKPLD